MSKLFPSPAKTYKTQENALKLFKQAGHLDDPIRYTMAVNDEGRFFVIVYITERMRLKGQDHFYFIDLGCCARVES